jgi:predicted oxidoreductase
LLILNGCDQNSKIVDENSEISTKLTELETKIITLETELNDVKQKIEFQQMLNGWDKEAYLTPGSEGYSLIKSDLGNLTVSIVNVLPYANGSKITLQFGNLTSATIDGLKTKLEWGPVDKDGLPMNEKTKSRDVVFNESLISGSWTNSDVVLEGIPPTDLGFVKLQNVTHRGVRLHR